MRTPLCDRFGIELPIFAFSHCRDVVAAVSRAGGFGVLGALAFSPEQLEIELKWIDDHVDGKPYGVDVVMPAKVAVEQGAKLTREALEQMLPERHRRFLEDLLAKYDVPPLPEGEHGAEGLLQWAGAGSRSQVDVALTHPIKLLVNALGPPPRDVVEQAHAHGVPVAALVGTAEQALKQVEVGVDLIVAQGSEAGGHTGEIGTMVLVPDVVDAVGPAVPVLAAGGIGCGRQVAASLALGAQGVWTGSIWLTVEESDTNKVTREKFLKADARSTVRSRAMTGKPARLLRTGWTEAWDATDSPGPLPMPLQFALTYDAIARINRFAHVDRSRARDILVYPVGQIVGRMNEVRPTRDVIVDLVDEFVDAVGRLQELMNAAER